MLRVKVLVYTATDFNEDSHQCIDLLVENMTIQSNVDFCVMSDREGPEGFKHKVISGGENYMYGGFLKYSRNIPKDYDYYVFLDPDIIYLGDPTELIDESKDMSLVMEWQHTMMDKWFYYPHAHKDHLPVIKQFHAINAGTFCFKDPMFPDKVRSIFEPYISGHLINDAILEQASFNYATCLALDFDFRKAKELSSMVQLFAGCNPYLWDRKLFHFCGFRKDMVTKYEDMQKFLRAREDTEAVKRGRL